MNEIESKYLAKKYDLYTNDGAAIKVGVPAPVVEDLDSTEEDSSSISESLANTEKSKYILKKYEKATFVHIIPHSLTKFSLDQTSDDQYELPSSDEEHTTSVR